VNQAFGRIILFFKKKIYITFLAKAFGCTNFLPKKERKEKQSIFSGQCLRLYKTNICSSKLVQSRAGLELKTSVCKPQGLASFCVLHMRRLSKSQVLQAALEEGLPHAEEQSLAVFIRKQPPSVTGIRQSPSPFTRLTSISQVPSASSAMRLVLGKAKARPWACRAISRGF